MATASNVIMSSRLSTSLRGRIFDLPIDIRPHILQNHPKVLKINFKKPERKIVSPPPDSYLTNITVRPQLKLDLSVR